MHIEETKLTELLLDSQLVSRTEVEKAGREAQKKSKSIGDILVEQGKLTHADVRRMQAHVLGIPFVSLVGKKIDFDILSLIPEPIARKHNVVAFEKTDKGISVAMLDVDDLQAIDFIKKKLGTSVFVRLTDTESIKYVLLQYQKSLKEEFGDIIKKEATLLKQVADDEQTTQSADELKKLAEDLPIVRIVDTLIKHAVLQGGSDIHIEQQEKQVLVRYRIDGILHDAMTLPKNAGPGIAARIKVLAKLKIDEKRLPQDGRFRMDLEEDRISFRVSTLPSHFGEKIVMRILHENTEGFTLENLGLHGDGLEAVHAATRQKTGLILTTGPTGSGKTTTLYTLLDVLNTPEINISTVEDPIEYQMPRINQTQVKPDIGLSFSNGLRALMRQDPDVIMVGEIRDEETASLAINAALTGHLVLSTLHTNSAAGAVPRLLDMKVKPFLLSSTLQVVIGQRLVRQLCKKKEQHRLSKSELQELGKSLDLDRMLGFLRAEGVVKKSGTWSDVVFYKPVASSECADGYKGRIGIHEILHVTPTIKELVIQGATSDVIEKQAKEEGMMTMLEDGIFQAARGITTIEEVLRVISE